VLPEEYREAGVGIVYKRGVLDKKNDGQNESNCARDDGFLDISLMHIPTLIRFSHDGRLISPIKHKNQEYGPTQITSILKIQQSQEISRKANRI